MAMNYFLKMLNGEKVNFNDIKAGAKLEDVKESRFRSIFTALDSNKNNILDETEVQQFLEIVKQFAEKHKTNNLGDKEFEKLKEALGEKFQNLTKEDLLGFIEELNTNKSGAGEIKHSTEGQINCTEYNYENGSRVIVYSNGNTKFIDSDGNETVTDSQGNIVKQTVNRDGEIYTVEKSYDETKESTFDKKTGVTTVIVKDKNQDIKYHAEIKDGIETRTINHDSFKEIRTINNNEPSKPQESHYEDWQGRPVDSHGNLLNPPKQEVERPKTTQVIVQNGESIAMLAKKFGCSIQEIIDANPDKVKGKEPNQYFLVGEDITIPRDIPEEKLEGRQTSKQVIAAYTESANIVNTHSKAIVTGDNGYYVTKDADGTLHFYNDEGKEISGEEFKKYCPTIYRNLTEREEINNTQNKKTEEDARVQKASAQKIVDELMKAVKGWNDIDAIKKAIARIDNPTELAEVNRLLAQKGYKADDKYSSIEKFIYEENNHSYVHTYNSSDYLEQIVQKWIDDGTLKGQAANEAQARMACRVIFDGGDGFGTDCEKIKKGIRMIKCPKATGDKSIDNKNAREVYKLVNEIIQKHRTFYGLGSSCNDLRDYCKGEMWESEVKYLDGILAENEAIEGEEKAKAVADLVEEAVEGAGTSIEDLKQAIKAIKSPEDRKAVEAKLKEYCEKKGIKPKIKGQSYLQAILYDELDTFLGISTDHKEIRKFNEMLIEQGAYSAEEAKNLRAEQAALQILEGDFSNIKDAIAQIKDKAIYEKLQELLNTKGYRDLDDFLEHKLNAQKCDLVNAELAANCIIDGNKAANTAFRLIQSKDFDTRAMGLRAIRTGEVAKLVDKKLKTIGTSLKEVVDKFNKEKEQYKDKAAFWDGIGKILSPILAETISDAYRENTDVSDNMYVESDIEQSLTPSQKQAYNTTVKIFEQKLEKMKRDYQEALDSQGVVSGAVNTFCEIYGIGTTREEIEARIEHDTETLRLLKLAAEGKLSKMVDGELQAVNFEDIFVERTGTSFDIEKVEKVAKEAEMTFAIGYAKDAIAVCWDELSNAETQKELSAAIVDTLNKLSELSGKQMSLEYMGWTLENGLIVEKSTGEPVIIDKLKQAAVQLKQGLSDISNSMFGTTISKNSDYYTVKNSLENGYNKKIDSFKQQYREAFGTDTPDEMIENYISTINTGKTVVNIGVVIGAAIAAPFTGGGSLAVFATSAAASFGINALEKSTDADGYTNSEWTSDASQAIWDGILTTAGVKIGQIAEGFAKGTSAVMSQNKWLSKLPKGEVQKVLQKAEEIATKIQNNTAKIGKGVLESTKARITTLLPGINPSTAETIAIIVARTEACGIEVASDTLQSLLQMYCMEGNFDKESFLQSLILSLAANAAGHGLALKGDTVEVKGSKAVSETSITTSGSKSETPNKANSVEKSKAESSADSQNRAEETKKAQDAEAQNRADEAKKAQDAEAQNRADEAKKAQDAKTAPEMSYDEYLEMDIQIKELQREIESLKSNAPRGKNTLSAEQVNQYKKVLGIPDNVELTADVLKNAYRKKALECHPDNGGTTKAFQEVGEANDRLKKHLDNGGKINNNAAIIAEKEARLNELKAQKQKAHETELKRFEKETNTKISELNDNEVLEFGRTDTYALSREGVSSRNSRRQIRIQKQNGKYILENIGSNPIKIKSLKTGQVLELNGKSGSHANLSPAKYQIEFPDGTIMEIEIPAAKSSSAAHSADNINGGRASSSAANRDNVKTPSGARTYTDNYAKGDKVDFDYNHASGVEKKALFGKKHKTVKYPDGTKAKIYPDNNGKIHLIKEYDSNGKLIREIQFDYIIDNGQERWFRTIRENQDGKIIEHTDWGERKVREASFDAKMKNAEKMEDFTMQPNMHMEASINTRVRIGGPYGVEINFADYKNKFATMRDGDSFFIGRTVNGANDIRINNQYVSGTHLKVEKLNGKIYVMDVGSTNGSIINPKKAKQKSAADDINNDELCRVAGNDGKPLDPNYVQNSREARNHINESIESGEYLKDWESYKKVIARAHQIAYAGQNGNHRYYIDERTGKLLKMSAGTVRGAGDPFFRPYSNYVEMSQKIEEIARKYGDPYNCRTGAQRVKLKGIPEDSLPINDGTTHIYPAGKDMDAYFKQMHRTAKETMQLIESGAPKEKILAKIAEHYQYAANARPYDQINNSLFMIEVNNMLKKAGLRTMPHGNLDHAAQRLQPNAFIKYFIDEYYKTAL